MNKIIVALDGMTKNEVLSFLDSNSKNLVHIKIGLELFCKYGRDFVQEIAEKYKVDIFLDLKLHDIPTTVAKAIKSLEGLNIKFLTVHLSGGLSMIKHAMEAKEKYIPNTNILGVSVLTSLDNSDAQMIWNNDTSNAFTKLYSIAKDAKIDGIVSSPHELSLIKNLDDNIIKVCPGIRFKDDDIGDQKRVMTPKEAFAQGADYLVIGRSITNNPSVLKNIQEHI